MSSVCTAPELSTHVETPTILLEQPQAHRTRLGFWRTLIHRITTHNTLHEKQVALCTARRPFEAPIDQLVREHPSLSVCVLATV